MGSDSPRRRLERALKRNPTFRAIEPDDFKWLFVSYKKGILGFPINPPEGMPEGQAFRVAAEQFILETFDFGWTFVMDRPVGVLFGVKAGPYVVLGDAHWFPWATARNKMETIAKFLSSADIPMMWFTDRIEDKDFYTRMAKMGIARRIGTGYGAGRRAFFEVVTNG